MYLGSQPIRTCLERLLKLAKLQAYNDSTAMDGSGNFPLKTVFPGRNFQWAIFSLVLPRGFSVPMDSFLGDRYMESSSPSG